jgi:hypothetical protein
MKHSMRERGRQNVTYYFNCLQIPKFIVLSLKTSSSGTFRRQGERRNLGQRSISSTFAHTFGNARDNVRSGINFIIIVKAA